MAIHRRLLVGLGVLLASLAGATAVGAQGAAPTCHGLDATIEVTDATATMQIEGTEGDDVMVISLSPDDPIGFNIAVDGRGGDDVICASGVHTVVGGA